MSKRVEGYHLDLELWRYSPFLSISSPSTSITASSPPPPPPPPSGRGQERAGLVAALPMQTEIKFQRIWTTAPPLMTFTSNKAELSGHDGAAHGT